MLVDYFAIAYKNVRKRGIRSWLTVLGIFIGVAAVVSLISLGNGLQAAVNAQFGVSSTEIISVQAGGLTGGGPPGTGVVNPLTEGDVEAIEDLNLVETAIKRNVRTLTLEFNDVQEIEFATNVPDGDDRELLYETIDIEPEEGRLLEDGDTKRVVLGNNFKTNEETWGRPIEIGDSVLLKDESYKVVGIIKKKGSFIFDNVVLLNEEDMADLVDYGEEVDIIAVKVENSEDLDLAKADIEELLRDRRDVDLGEEDFEVSTPESSLSTVNSVLNGVRVFIAMIAAISILVGTIGIVNTMTTAVTERKKDIGIMKAVGAKNSHIFTIFLIESGLLGLVGGLLGVMAGTAAGYYGTLAIGNFIGSLIEPQIDLMLLIAPIIGGFILGAIAGIIPALRAANQNPVDALRS